MTIQTKVTKCGNYIVYSDGRVWSKRTKDFLRPDLNSTGYRRVMLGRGRRIMVHRLVALAFLPNPNKLLTVDHIDMNRLNNDVSNLEWVSHLENNIRAKSIPFKVVSPTGETYTGLVATHFAKEHGLDSGGFNKLLNGKQLSHKGWKLCMDG